MAMQPSDLRFVVADRYVYKIANSLNEPDLGFRFLKTKYDEEKDPIGDMLVDYPEFIQFIDFFTVNWDKVKPISITEIPDLAKDTDKRRALFGALPASLAYNKFGIHVKEETVRMIQDWGESYIDTTFTLMKCPVAKLYPDVNPSALVIPFVYAVKVACPSTGSIYYIQLPTDAPFIKDPDPVSAIAWTVYTRVDYSQIKAVVRQGDIINIVTTIGQDSKEVLKFVEPYHFTRGQYLEKVIFQS